MDDLVTWLREQIADAEDEARADEWNRPHGPGCAITADNCPGCDCDYARTVLAQCEAHTAILDEHAHQPATRNWAEYAEHTFGCGACHSNSDGDVWAYGWCATTRALALAYQHRPGYREEWRP